MIRARWTSVGPTRVRACALAAVMFAASHGVRAQSAPPVPLTLANAIARAMAANPTIAAARLRRPVDLAAVRVAGERPNPELGYEAAKETPRQALGVTVPIELGGKRTRRIELANATVAVGDADLARVTAEVRSDVRRAYFEAVAADMRAQMAGDLRGLAQRARDAANARVIAGDVPRSDLTLSDLALATGESDLVAARAEAAAARIELNLLLGQPADTPLTLVDPLTSGSALPQQEALALARQSNVDLALLERQVAEQEARVRLAKALKTPDVSAGGTFTYDAEPEFRYGWRVAGGVTLPIFTAHQAGVVVEESALAWLLRERDAQLARIGGTIAAAVVRAAAAREQLDRYERSILPLALESERQAQAAYSGGQIGLPVLVQSLMTARDTRQRGLQAALDYQRALIDLERAIGAGPIGAGR